MNKITLGLFIATSLLLSACNKYYVVTGNLEEDEQLYFGNLQFISQATRSKVGVCVTELKSQHKECPVYLPKHYTWIVSLMDVEEDGTLKPLTTRDVVAFSANKNEELAITGIDIRPISSGSISTYEFEKPIVLKGAHKYNYIGTIRVTPGNKVEVVPDFDTNGHLGIKKYNIPPGAEIGKMPKATSGMNMVKSGSVFYMPVLK